MKSKKPSVGSWAKSGSGRRIVFLVLLVSIWDAVFRLGLYQGYLLPSPEDVVTTFVRGLRDGSFLLATEDGVKNTPPLLIRAGRTMGMRGLALYTRVVLPSALPAIVSGMKLGWSFAWRSLMAGELLFVSAGLGHLLTVGRDLNDMSLVIAVMILIVLVGLFVDRLVFGTAERAIRKRWGLAGSHA